jgi:hypothetical protein
MGASTIHLLFDVQAVVDLTRKQDFIFANA